MKKKESKTSYFCYECIHKEICKKFLNTYKSLLNNQTCFRNIEEEVTEDCDNFCYKGKYTLEDSKEILIEKVQNSKNARHLLIIDSIFKLLEENDEKKTG